MTAISLILFDLNGVLYHYNRQVRIARLAAVSGLDPAAVKAAVWDSGFEDSGDAGLTDAEAYLRGFGTCLGYDLTEDAWVAAQLAAVSPIRETLALLGRIQVRCAVLTNNNFLVLRHFAEFYPEVAASVGDGTCVSAEFGVRKPDPQVYRRCLRRLGAAPPAVLFVDDSAANVAGARQAGLQGYEYAGSDALAAELLRRGVLSG